MKKPKGVPTLYVYDNVSSTTGQDSSTSNNIVAFIAPNDDFMTYIFKKFEGNWGTSWGDFRSFERIDGDGGFDKWTLRKTLKLTSDGLEFLGVDLEDFEENVETPLEDLSINDFKIYRFNFGISNKYYTKMQNIDKAFEYIEDLTSTNNQFFDVIYATRYWKKHLDISIWDARLSYNID